MGKAKAPAKSRDEIARTVPVEEYVQLTAPCGWCMTGDHPECMEVSPGSYGKAWLCGCKKCHPDGVEHP